MKKEILTVSEEVNLGWIKLHRVLLSHWIYKDAEKFKAWISILLNVNHTEKKVLINEKLLVVRRGESVRSYDSWSREFGKGWNRSKTIRFLKLLEKDNMIQLTNEIVTTRLRVVNYDKFQTESYTTPSERDVRIFQAEKPHKGNTNLSADSEEILEYCISLTGERVILDKPRELKAIEHRLCSGSSKDELMSIFSNVVRKYLYNNKKQFLLKPSVLFSDKNFQSNKSAADGDQKRLEIGEKLIEVENIYGHKSNITQAEYDKAEADFYHTI